MLGKERDVLKTSLLAVKYSTIRFVRFLETLFVFSSFEHAKSEEFSNFLRFVASFQHVCANFKLFIAMIYGTMHVSK